MLDVALVSARIEFIFLLVVVVLLVFSFLFCPNELSLSHPTGFHFFLMLSQVPEREVGG